ncbi:MAG: hypothetical protein OEZ29_08870 [Candidatus Bathyarchaeota archaeon]|nr:hypothetical protein [Candidatus Bathyarchaeota archaeon]MDH5780688.1 hypothetical protein [Candidatus Bathyarchaeota archaeon]
MSLEENKAIVRKVVEEVTSRRLLRQLYGLCKSCRKLIIWDKKGRVVALDLPPTPTDRKELK